MRMVNDRMQALQNAGRQEGVVLLLGLIMLLLISIVSMAAIRGSGLQESMAGNMRDRNLALQAAEAGLRDGERLLSDATLPPFDGSRPGYYQDMDGSKTSGFWSDYDWDDSETSSINLEWVAEQPRLVIEEVTYTVVAGSEGSAIDFSSQLNAEDALLYRVTSQGTGGRDSTRVVLQSTYKR